MSAITLLADQAKNFSILYVEDNRSLNQKVEQFLYKFFAKVFVAYDGIEGLIHYKEFKPDIVVTDIKMPKLDGIALSKKIKHIDPSAKIIILSAYDEKEYLYTAIELGVYRFVKKPVDIQNFTKILLELVLEIKHEKRVASLKKYEASGNLVGIFEDKKLKLANDNFLKFFGLTDEEQFGTKYPNLDTLFANQKGFLSSSTISWYDKLAHNIEKSYQVMVKDKTNESKHLILKAHFIDDDAFEKRNDILLSFTDITDLNLLPITQNPNTYEENKTATLKLLRHLKETKSSVNLHNFYKGLTITNLGQIAFVNENKIALKTRPNQQKAILEQGVVVLSSNLLPSDILCEGVENCDLDNFITTIKSYRLLDTTPRKRKTIRVEPDNNYKATLIFNAKEFTIVAIEDISIEAIRFSLNALPAGLDAQRDIVVALEFFKKDEMVDGFKLKAKVFKVWMSDFVYNVVGVFEIDKEIENKLLQYISKRQLELIREFKSL